MSLSGVSVDGSNFEETFYCQRSECLSFAIWHLYTNISFATTFDLSRELSLSDPQIVANLAHEFATSFRTWGSGDFLAALSSRPEIEKKDRG